MFSEFEKRDRGFATKTIGMSELFFANKTNIATTQVVHMKNYKHTHQVNDKPFLAWNGPTLVPKNTGKLIFN